jgi:hypothetical protein
VGDRNAGHSREPLFLFSTRPDSFSDNSFHVPLPSPPQNGIDRRRNGSRLKPETPPGRHVGCYLREAHKYRHNS